MPLMNLVGITLNSGVKKIEENAFQYCDSATELIIPNSVETIGNNVCEYSGFQNIVIGDGTKTIGESAFRYCRNLQTIKLGKNLTSIGESAFQGTAITEITIPKGITVMGTGWFMECNKLETIKFPEHEIIPTFTSDSRPGFGTTKYIEVPANLVSAWKAADRWSDFENMIRAIN